MGVNYFDAHRSLWPLMVITLLIEKEVIPNKPVPTNSRNEGCVGKGLVFANFRPGNLTRRHVTLVEKACIAVAAESTLYVQ